MDADKFSVFGSTDVDFDEVCAEIEGFGVSGEGVFGDSDMGAAVGDDVGGFVMTPLRQEEQWNWFESLAEYDSGMLQ